ncbi:MAG: hypothetical protein ACYDHN_15065 [Solirubrobacteraceae bacterium]
MDQAFAVRNSAHGGLRARPSILESSNPANDLRYRSLGFERVGEFSTPDGSRFS